MSNKARPRKKRRSDDIRHARQMPQRDNAERLPNGDWRVTLPVRHGVSAKAVEEGDAPVVTNNGRPHTVVEVVDDYTLVLRPWSKVEALKSRLRTAKNVLLARPGR